MLSREANTASKPFNFLIDFFFFFSRLFRSNFLGSPSHPMMSHSLVHCLILMFYVCIVLYTHMCIFAVILLQKKKRAGNRNEMKLATGSCIDARKISSLVWFCAKKKGGWIFYYYCFILRNKRIFVIHNTPCNIDFGLVHLSLLYSGATW